MQELETLEKKYTVKQVAEICGVNVRTINNVVVGLLENDVQKFGKVITVSTGGRPSKFFNEEQLKAIQKQLKLNAISQGKQSEIIKRDNIGDMAIGCVFTKGTVEEQRDMIALLTIKVNTQEALEKTNKKVLQLEQDKKQLEHALEYDQIVDWKAWGKLKNSWKPQFEELHHKINFNELIKRANLIKEKDYKKIPMGFDTHPTTMISPSGEEKLWDYFDR